MLTGDPVTYHAPSMTGEVRLETFIPWKLIKRGVRRLVITPIDAPQEFLEEARHERQARETAQDTPLMRALGLAHHWQHLLDEGRFASLTEIATAEGIDLGQASKVSRLAQLAPELIEAIALGRLEVGVSQLLRGRLSASWSAQREGMPRPAVHDQGRRTLRRRTGHGQGAAHRAARGLAGEVVQRDPVGLAAHRVDEGFQPGALR